MTDDERETFILAHHNGTHEPDCDLCFLVGRIQRARKREYMTTDTEREEQIRNGFHLGQDRELLLRLLDESRREAAQRQTERNEARGQYHRALERIVELEAEIARLTGLQMSHEGHDQLCYYCSEPCNALAGNPGLWPVPLCHSDDPGMVKWHHQNCVSERLEQFARLTAPPGASAMEQAEKIVGEHFRIRVPLIDADSYAYDAEQAIARVIERAARIAHNRAIEEATQLLNEEAKRRMTAQIPGVYVVEVCISLTRTLEK